MILLPNLNGAYRYCFLLVDNIDCLQNFKTQPLSSVCYSLLQLHSGQNTCYENGHLFIMLNFDANVFLSREQMSHRRRVL